MRIIDMLQLDPSRFVRPLCDGFQAVVSLLGKIPKSSGKIHVSAKKWITEDCIWKEREFYFISNTARRL